MPGVALVPGVPGVAPVPGMPGVVLVAVAVGPGVDIVPGTVVVPGVDIVVLVPGAVPGRAVDLPGAVGHRPALPPGQARRVARSRQGPRWGVRVVLRGHDSP